LTLPIALDAMGGDFAPSLIIQGARRAVDELGLNVILVGVPELMGDPLGLEVVACTEVIEMDDEPGTSVRKKKDSSLVRAAELVRDGKASAMVSAGNTGATMASALLRMGRLPGVVRPCIATPIPNPGRAPSTMVDAGANAECTPEMLVQFAQLAAAFAGARFGIDRPSVGLLSIGEESSKGNPLVKETHELLAASDMNFFGNVEGRDLIPAPVDVIVTDGFTGNVVLKMAESFYEIAAARNLNQDAYLSRFHYENYGGTPVLGVAKPVIIGHGISSAVAFKNMVLLAQKMVETNFCNTLKEAFISA